MRRIGNQSRRAFGKLTDPAVYRAFKAQGGFDYPPFPEPLISIDTESMQAPEAAGKIVNAVLAVS